MCAQKLSMGSNWQDQWETQGLPLMLGLKDHARTQGLGYGCSAVLFVKSPPISALAMKESLGKGGREGTDMKFSVSFLIRLAGNF